MDGSLLYFSIFICSRVDIENPKMVLIVGGIGLLCNLLGLVLFHDHSGHGHSHGGHSHGHSHSHSKKPKAISNSSADEPVVAASDNEKESKRVPHPLRHQSSLERISPLRQANIQNLQQAALEVQQQIEIEERYAQQDAEETRSRSRVHSGASSRLDAVVVSMEVTQVLSAEHNHDHSHDHDDGAHDHDHDHDHAHDDDKSGTKPSGEDLNMQGIFLHVLGDALGSVGVIFTALFVWLTDFSWRFYMDPIIRCILVLLSSLLHGCMIWQYNPPF